MSDCHARRQHQCAEHKRLQRPHGLILPVYLLQNRFQAADARRNSGVSNENCGYPCENSSKYRSVLFLVVSLSLQRLLALSMSSSSSISRWRSPCSRSLMAKYVAIQITTRAMKGTVLRNFP